MSQVVQQIRDKFEVVLASSSPRRYEIVTEVMGFSQVKLMKPSFEENLDKSLYEGKPIKYVHDTSKGKALGIIEDLGKLACGYAQKPKLVICADTVVIDSDNTIHEKPQVPQRQLTNLLDFRDSDDPVKVVTSVTLIKWQGPDDYTLEQFEEISEVYFDPDFPLSILYDYVDSKDALDVAGGFKVQSFGGAMISKINGDFYNVVGLPLNKTFKALYKAAFPLEQ
ncbi:LANO_0H13762g1_1 [Lachancea nothofagi CBS 11611]|uniref:LANO_0H13762g1_1 n=1 Tax=Lachancea nothofagi CBS 11611 TaxID=1266666 RepID=A0A1G4KMC9_9SACH|nr:LANO_0H13762g1_1 [Lachancea nothofagi CBS 11611]